MWVYEDSQAALRDGLRLSRAMTYKNAVADLALGGGKGVIMIPPNVKLSRERRQAALLDFAETVDAVGGRYITAEDVGTSSRDMSLIATRTKHVAGLSRRRGGSGDPSPMTALGVYIAIQTCCDRAFGSPSVRGRTVSLLGFGHVGERVARRCAKDGAKLIVADVNEERRAAAEGLGARWTTPEKALEADVDVLAPCALGGVLNEESVPRLRCQIIAGAANNQLATDGIADLLARRRILWAPDFVANAGGVINISAELGGYDPAVARKRVRGIEGTLRQIFDDADSIGATPMTAALELARKRLFASAESVDGRAV
jgi:leucine dehydrogenase